MQKFIRKKENKLAKLRKHASRRVRFGSNKLTKLGRCDRETIELANYSNDGIVRTAGRTSKY